MAEGKVIESPLKGKKDDGLGRYLLFLIIIFAALWALNNQYASQIRPDSASSGAPSPGLADNQRYVAEQAGMLLAGNPNMAEQDAADKVIYDIAIQEKNKALCGRIQGRYLGDRCLKYFAINGLG